MRNILLPILMLGTLASCGSPRTVVKVSNKADGTETTIQATTGDGGTTSVTVSPKIELKTNADTLMKH